MLGDAAAFAAVKDSNRNFAQSLIGRAEDGGLGNPLAAIECSFDLGCGDILTAANDDGIGETLRRMRQLGVRRVPVVGPGGRVSGVLSIDDVVDHLVGQLSDVSGSVRNELQFERTLQT